MRSGADVVHRRVGIERLELRRVLRRAVVALPTGALSEAVEAQHVEHADLRHGGAEQVRSLRQTRADQQPAVGAAEDRQVRHGGVVVRDQPVGRGDEVIEHHLLVGEDRLAVPDLPVLAAATDIGDCEHPAALHPGDHRRIEARQVGDAETAVTDEQQRIVALEIRCPCGKPAAAGCACRPWRDKRPAAARSPPGRRPACGSAEHAAAARWRSRSDRRSAAGSYRRRRRRSPDPAPGPRSRAPCRVRAARSPRAPCRRGRTAGPGCARRESCARSAGAQPGVTLPAPSSIASRPSAHHRLPVRLLRMQRIDRDHAAVGRAERGQEVKLTRRRRPRIRTPRESRAPRAPPSARRLDRSMR